MTALFLPFLSIGAVGIISVIAHVASNPMQQLVQAFDRGDITTARRLANQLAPLVHALNGDGYQAVMAKAVSRSRALSLHHHASADNRSRRHSA